LLAPAALCSLLVAACGAAASSQGDAVPYLDDASFRRAELEASLVNPDNEYSRQRLDHY
jgi:hypothetical protein